MAAKCGQNSFGREKYFKFYNKEGQKYPFSTPANTIMKANLSILTKLQDLFDKLREFGSNAIKTVTFTH